VGKGALVGAALGGLSDAVIQLLTKPINEFSWNQVLQSTVAGAVSGAFGALTGIGGAAKGLSFANTVILGALDGWLSGMLSRGVMNLLAGNSFFDGYTWHMALVDLITGGLMSGIFYGVGRALSHVIDSIPPLSCRANSFSADTTVVTKDGDTPIHEIEIGDYVLAWNEETGEIGWYKVTDTIHHTDEVVIHLTIDGEEIETTPEHPFYVEGTGWINAEDLQLGDDIRNADGSTGVVESIELETTSQEMYNLTVDEAHTFFVGDGQWLVHNTKCPPLVGQFPSKADEIPGPLQNGFTNIDNLIPIHPPDTPGNIDKLIKSINENGFNLNYAIPVIKVDDGTFILAGGHHRTATLRALGFDEVPIVFSEIGFTAAEANVFLASFNPKRLRILR